MSKPAFTEGPWQRFDCNQPGDLRVYGTTIISEEFGEIAEIIYCRTDTATDEANARLISAAPDLYEACRALPDFDIEQPDAADFKDHAEEFIRAMKLARTALAKADGEEVTS